MDRLRVHVNFRRLTGAFLLVLFVAHSSTALTEEYFLDSGVTSPFSYDIVTLDHVRNRRETVENTTNSAPPQSTVPSAPTVANASATTIKIPVPDTENATAASNVSVTQTPLLGENGHGILHVDVLGKLPKVSDPIVPDDIPIVRIRVMTDEDLLSKERPMTISGLLKAFDEDDDYFKDVFETPERIQSEQNLKNLTYDNHNFYNSSFIGNEEYFKQHWANITINKASVHSVLSNSHRRATSIQLSFDFPFYGHNVRNVTVATGGFIYTGEHVHNWLAATQYIAPLMANFDTTLTNDSVIKIFDDGEKFTAFWENVTLQEDTAKKFTFAVTLYKNGDITFAYKNIPIDVQDINDKDHPVKVGISDAYLTDKIVFYVRRKTIYEYHRVSFKDHLITNNTLLKIIALPTCLQYDTCDSCLNHNTGFNCTWCPQIQKCSSGTDRNKQDWLLRKCEKNTIVNVTGCVAVKAEETSDTSGVAVTGNTAYTTDPINLPPHETVIKTGAEPIGQVSQSVQPAAPEQARSAIGGVVAAFLAITLVVSVAAWILYAFKNPHTRSGQILIKYRPSQWNWRRGEARYTAATIHM